MRFLTSRLIRGGETCFAAHIQFPTGMGLESSPFFAPVSYGEDISQFASAAVVVQNSQPRPAAMGENPFRYAVLRGFGTQAIVLRVSWHQFCFFRIPRGPESSVKERTNR